MPNLTDEQIREIAKTPLDKVDLAFPSASKEALKLKAVPEALRVFYDLDPVSKWILLRKIEREITAHGDSQIVHAVDVSRSNVGIIEAISELCEQKKLQIGDRVIFTNFMLSLPDIEESTGRRDLFLVREEEIYCRLIERPRPATLFIEESSTTVNYEDAPVIPSDAPEEPVAP